MDTTKIKAVLGQLSLLRNYSKLLLPAVLAIVAVFLMIAAPMMGKRLRQQIQSESINNADRISQLSEEGISREQWQIAQRQKEAYAEDANSIENLTIQSTQRPLLDYDIFPEPSDESAYLFRDFGRGYQQALDDLFVDVNAGLPPSEAEIERHMGRSSTANTAAGGNRDRSTDQRSTIVDLVCQQRAQSLSFYADVETLPGYEFWSDYSYDGLEQGVEDCWRSQISYWIVEDIANTVQQANDDQPNVLEAPVKRVLGISFTGDRDSRTQRDGEVPLARYIEDQSEWFAQSFTGRVSNSDVDVVHFKVELLIDARYIMSFISQLQNAKTHTFAGWDGSEQSQQFKHNQITVLRNTYQPIDRNADEHRYYRYGQAGVVQLDLICEYLFYTEGYESVKPGDDDDTEQDDTQDDYGYTY